MSIIKTLTQFINKEAKVKANRPRLIYEWYRDYDGSTTSSVRGPWNHWASEGFIKAMLQSGKATVSLMMEVGYINERLRHKLVHLPDVMEGLEDINIDKVIRISALNKEDVISKYNSIDKKEIKALMDNFKLNIIPSIEDAAINESLAKVYVICIIIDILTGALPDIYRDNKHQVYTVEKARRILNEFPIRAKKADTVELRSANLIIASYCFGITNNVDWMHVADILCDLTQYQRVVDIGCANAFKMARLDINKLTWDAIKEFAKENAEVDKLFSMLRYALVQNNQPFKEEVLEKFIVSESGRYATSYSTDSPNSKYYHYVLYNGFRLHRVPKNMY